MEFNSLIFNKKQMLKKENRISNKKDFEKVFKKGTSYKEDFFVLKILKNNIGIIRGGIIVSKKISKKSTIRNKIKRRIVNILTPQIPLLNKGIDMVFITKPGIEKEKTLKIKEKIKETFKRAKLLK